MNISNTFYRLIKPSWAKPTKDNKEANPDFIKEISGPNVIEGCFNSEDVNRMNKMGYNAYFFPNHPNTNVYTDGVKHLSGRHISVFNFVFVDMDLKDGKYNTIEDFHKKLKDFKILPTMVVDSGHGVHAYWKIDNLTREQYLFTQMSLISYFETDSSIWTVLQLMRVPGSLNTKVHNNFKVASINTELSSNKEYSISDFPFDIYNISEDLATKVRLHCDKLDGKILMDITRDVNLDEIPESFLDLMEKDLKIKELYYDPTKAYGDRSGADMKLTNILFNKNIPKKEALQIIANSQKALSKGPARQEYASSTVDKVYKDRVKNSFKTVGERLREGITDFELEPIRGPYYMDTGVLTKTWSKTQLLGLIAGTGVGKTSITLNMMKEIINNNPDNDDIFIFFTLEMPEKEIIDRWIDLVGSGSSLADRLYVISNEDESGDPRNIGLQEIFEYCQDIKKSTGKEINCLAIDHFGLISNHIDTRKKYTFGINSEMGTGWGDIRTLSNNNKATQLKSLVKMLNCFGIILTQTTKEKGIGDLPIGKDGAYGISQYENIMDYIITAWQPLMRVKHKCGLDMLAWQYAKIRHQKGKTDKIKELEHKLLSYDSNTGSLNPPTDEEYIRFQEWLPQAEAIRDQLSKKKGAEYSKSLNFADLQQATQHLTMINGESQ